MTNRVKYSKKFKLHAISLALQQGYERKAAAESDIVKQMHTPD